MTVRSGPANATLLAHHRPDCHAVIQRPKAPDPARTFRSASRRARVRRDLGHFEARPRPALGEALVRLEADAQTFLARAELDRIVLHPEERLQIVAQARDLPLERVEAHALSMRRDAFVVEAAPVGDFAA